MQELSTAPKNQVLELEIFFFFDFFSQSTASITITSISSNSPVPIQQFELQLHITMPHTVKVHENNGASSAPLSEFVSSSFSFLNMPGCCDCYGVVV